MAEQSVESVRGLIQGVLEDTRDLIRAELALAKAEVREEISAAQTVGIAFSGAALGGLVGATFCCLAIGGGIAYALQWPPWAGYGSVGVLLLIGAWVLARYGSGQLSKIRTLPNTRQTVKENLEWIQNRSVER
jgi:hypothetical protein